MGKKKNQAVVLKNRPLALAGLKRLREAKGWSQQDLADKMGTTDVTVSRNESGRQNWSQEFLQEAAKQIGCHWVDLLPPLPGTILEAWASVPPEDRKRAIEAVRLFGKRHAA